MVSTTIVNDTGIPIILSIGNGGILRALTTIPIGGKYSCLFDLNATYHEYFMTDIVNGRNRCILTSDDLIDFSEVKIYLKRKLAGVSEKELVLGFARNPRRTNLDDLAFKTAQDNVSLKIHAALGSFTDLRELLKTVRICRNQCNHLVQTYEDGIQKMKHLHSKLAEDPTVMWSFYKAGRLTQLFNSLDSLAYIVCDVKDLLGACAKELERMALVVSSMPMPPDGQKDMEVCSKFDLLVGELMWNFDLIEYELKPEGAVELEWCPIRRRFMLNPAQTPETVGGICSRARLDRRYLLSDESGSIFVLDSRVDITTGLTKSWYKQLKKLLLGKTQSEEKENHQSLARSQRELDILREIIVKRCKVETPFNQNPRRNLRSLSVDLECFRINHLDLKLNTNRVLGSGTFKNTYEGEWCGQRVAIATIRDFDLEELENEVKQLIGLQHPQVVSCFGWAYTEDAPPPIKTPEEEKDNLKCQGFYIITERMECDLEDLINNIRRAALTRRDSGGPFSLSVGLDILLQIVEAMLHVHKHDVMHRDLKPKNFLVNSRSSPRSGADNFYDVKLIDFGASKLFVDDKNTYDRGTTRYEAPEMLKGKGKVVGDHHGTYGLSVDVFSFAMTCYQVITGVEPFRNTVPRKEIQTGKRPGIPPTILSGLKELMEGCWAEDPDIRPTFEQIQERLWTIKKDLVVPIE